jgi:hypothetical protein
MAALNLRGRPFFSVSRFSNGSAPAVDASRQLHPDRFAAHPARLRDDPIKDRDIDILEAGG